MADHNILGEEGEKLAVKFLAEKGYKILATNWRFEKKEIDIVARNANTIIIVEVKTRTTEYFGKPEESVKLAKQKFLIAAANHFLCHLDFDAEVRFDIVSIIKTKQNVSIEHIEDAFIPLAE